MNYSIENLKNKPKVAIIYDYDSIWSFQVQKQSPDFEFSKEILKLSEQAKKEEKGVAMINGKFIGPPMVITAKNTLTKAELIKSKSDK